MPRKISDFEASRDRFDAALCAALLEAAEARRAGDEMAVWFISVTPPPPSSIEAEQRVIWEAA